MEFLGVGLPELAFIIIIILLVANPKDIAKTARLIGQWLNKLYKSDNYQLMQQASRELRHLPQRLAREAQLDELQKDLSGAGPPPAGSAPGLARDTLEAWTRELPPAPPSPDPTAPPKDGSPSE